MTNSAKNPPSPNVELLFLNQEEIEKVQDELIAIYRAAFDGPPYYEDEDDAQRFGRSLILHATRPGYTLLIARQYGRFSNRLHILGFAYGYTTTPGQWWHDTIRPALTEQQAQHWLANAFELVELAVLPAWQGQGIGGRLHDTLLASLPHRTAVLSTAQEETAALHLYRQRGWHTLVPHFHFPGHPAPFILMGYQLK
jgi:ribosomal protein S18 acetylase RimI-like enzyme